MLRLAIPNIISNTAVPLIGMVDMALILLLAARGITLTLMARRHVLKNP